jgi:hypothetical protein
MAEKRRSAALGAIEHSGCPVRAEGGAPTKISAINIYNRKITYGLPLV